MKKFEEQFIPLGMVGAVVYIAHTFLGNLLWPAYNPITMDISSLTADGAPHAQILRIFGLIYSSCMVLMAAALVKKAFVHYHNLVRAGYGVLLIMQLTSAVGYSLFPLTADKTEMNFQNRMHLIVTAVVIFTTLASSFLLSMGYLKQEKMKKLGRIALIFAIFILLFGMLNPIALGLGLNILGLTERLVVYTIQTFMFTLSYYHTFLEKK